VENTGSDRLMLFLTNANKRIKCTPQETGSGRTITSCRCSLGTMLIVSSNRLLVCSRFRAAFDVRDPMREDAYLGTVKLLEYCSVCGIY